MEFEEHVLNSFVADDSQWSNIQNPFTASQDSFEEQPHNSDEEQTGHLYESHQLPQESLHHFPPAVIQSVCILQAPIFSFEHFWQGISLQNVEHQLPPAEVQFDWEEQCHGVSLEQVIH